MGNTPAVARSSYVDPRVIDRYTAQATILGAASSLDGDPGSGGLSTHGAIEEAVLSLLSDEAAIEESAA